MKLQLEWDLPEATLDESFLQELTEAVKLETAIRLFEQGRISSGYAARLLGIPRLEFIDILRQRQIPLSQYGEGELEAEVETIRQIRVRPRHKP